MNKKEKEYFDYAKAQAEKSLSRFDKLIEELEKTHRCVECGDTEVKDEGDLCMECINGQSERLRDDILEKNETNKAKQIID